MVYNYYMVNKLNVWTMYKKYNVRIINFKKVHLYGEKIKKLNCKQNNIKLIYI